ncbi:MAG: hypothetical protein AB7S26_26235 [Sandaracinaceae bacterium]
MDVRSGAWAALIGAGLAGCEGGSGGAIAIAALIGLGASAIAKGGPKPPSRGEPMREVIAVEASEPASSAPPLASPEDERRERADAERRKARERLAEARSRIRIDGEEVPRCMIMRAGPSWCERQEGGR